MEHLLQKILGKLDNLEAGQQKLEAGQQQLQDDVAGLKIGQQELKYDVTALKAGQQKLEDDIAIIQKDTARIPYVEQAVSEINQEVQQVQVTVKGHKDTLDVLSARSIEHEGKLKHVI